MNDAIVFIAAKRTPFGAFGGSLKGLSATDLGVVAAKAALAQSGSASSHVDHVIFGNVFQTSADAAYLARHVGLRAGLAEAVPAVTVNRLCGSGFEAIIDGARRLQLGEATVVLVGGAESMSQAPYVLRKARFGYRLGTSEVEDSLTAGLFDPIPQIPMGMTAENLAEKYTIARESCDAFALQSQQNAARATKEGHFRDEMAPISLEEKGKTRLFETDEHIRAESSKESLAKLKPVFKKDGVVTAGNASGMVDGAAALVMTTERTAKANGWPILGEFIGAHAVGCDPKIMGIGPVPAIRKLLEKAKLTLKDMAFIEVNEAFAPQTLAVLKELQLAPETVNTDGGAIAIGHPLGASGARIATHLLYQLKRQGAGYGLGSACIGGGQGIAILLKARG